MLVSLPDSGEQALAIAVMLTQSGAVDLVVIDSVAALTPKAEIEGDMGDAHMGLQARLMSQALRKLTAIAHRTDTTLVFINQLRQKIGVVFGNPETTTGGNALKFYASMRFDVRRIGPVKVSEESIGSRTRVKIVKNKCSPPFKEAEFDIRWGTGVDAASDLIDYAMMLGIIEKSGSHLSFGGEHLGQGRERAREAVLAKGTLAGALRTAVEAAAPPPNTARLAPRPRREEGVMSDGLNRVILLGNLGQDPELKYMANGQAMLKLRLATNETYLDKNKERQEKVEWHWVVVFGPRAEALAKLLSKGSGVLVEGGLRTHSYEKDGVTRYTTEIVAREICFAGKRSEAQPSDGAPRYIPKSARNGSPKQESETLPLEDIPF